MKAFTFYASQQLTLGKRLVVGGIEDGFLNLGRRQQYLGRTSDQPVSSATGVVDGAHECGLLADRCAVKSIQCDPSREGAAPSIQCSAAGAAADALRQDLADDLPVEE